MFSGLRLGLAGGDYMPMSKNIRYYAMKWFADRVALKNTKPYDRVFEIHKNEIRLIMEAYCRKLDI